MSEQDEKSQGDIFARVLSGILRPLVRALIARGFTAPAFYRLIKRVYVEVAEQEFGLDDKRATDSRVSVLTGVHRRDVKQFREETAAGETFVRDKVTVLSTVVGHWLGSPKTTDDTGAPIPLPRSSDTGGLSFDSLVATVNRDVRPRTILDEMLRQRLVVPDETTGLLHLKTEAFVGPEDVGQKVYFFGENVGDHIAAAVDNLLNDDPPFLERAVFYNRLTPASVDTIEDEARRIGTDAMVHLNKLAYQHQTEDLDAEDGHERFRFGVFFYRATELPEDTGTDGTGGTHDDT